METLNHLVGVIHPAVLFYVLPLIGTILILCKEPDLADSVLVAIIPGVNFLGFAAALYMLIQRTVKSSGKCFTGHNYQEVYDSEREKWKNGRMPMRVSVGGYTRYQCTKCKGECTTKWSAF